MKQTGLKGLLSILLIACSIYSQAQMTGGRGDNQALPKEVKAAELSKGAYTSDVNLFSGTMNTSYDLGTVSTFAGLKYNLELSYSSTKTIGQNPLVVNGIPYGEGWSLNIPTINISVASYQKYLGSELPLYNNINSTTNPSFSKTQIAQEGSLFWFAPIISIPGVVSDRFIFKNYDAVSGESIFVANIMDHYVEARFNGSVWHVTNDNGDVYEFKSMVTNYRASSSLKFDADSVKTCRSCMAANLLPREEAMTWFCDDIYNKNHPLNQKISFSYNTFGVFDFFRELSGDYQHLLNTTLDGDYVGSGMGFPSFKASRDIMLQSIGAYSDRGDIERIDLGYKTVMPPPSQKNMLLPGAAGVKRLDSLYNYRAVYSHGVNNATDSATIHSNVYNASLGDPMVHTDFENWRRYQHVMASTDRSGGTTAIGGDHHPDFFDLRNPYLQSHNSDSQGRYSYNSLTAANDLSFSHGFLESEKITTGLVPGDLYEIKTAIYNGNTSGLAAGPKMCNYDINIVSGTPYYNTSGIEDLPASGGTHVSGGDFINGSRGFEVFTTFNNPVKWSSYGRDATSGVTGTSNFFLMPKMPSNFKGINIQVGPANSDHDFSLDMMKFINQVSSYSFQDNAYLTYERARMIYSTNNPITPNSTNGLDNPFRKPGHNFGIGMPWYMMGKLYADMSDLTDNPSSSRFHFWWKDNNVLFDATASPYSTNRPTAADDNVILGAVELVRYSKNPYMLSSVKKYKLNGYASLDTSLHGYVLVSQLDLAYAVKTDTLFEYAFGTSTVSPCQKSFVGKTMIGWQNAYVLRSVRQVPVNGAAGNASASYTYGNLPTTWFDYSKVTLNPSHMNTQTGGDFCGNLYVLRKITDQLGGLMSYDYYPITDSVNTQWQVIYQDYARPVCTAALPVYDPNPYHMPLKNAYKVQLAVRQKNFYNSASDPLPVKTWTYAYGSGAAYTFCNGANANVRRSRMIYTGSPQTDHYVTDGGFDVDMGFQYTTVKYPSLTAGATMVPYDKYTHFATENRGLTFGKLKALEHYDAAGLLLSRTDYTYAATMAYPHVLLNDNRITSRYVNQTNLEFTNSVRRHSGGNPANTPSNLATLNNLSTARIYGSNLRLFDLVDTADFASATGVGNNSYFVRLTTEKHTDYDYQPLTSGQWGSVFSSGSLSGVNLGNISLPSPGPLAGRMASAPAISAYSGISALKLGISAGLAAPPIGPALNPQLLQKQTSLSTLTQYDYWDCDSLGISRSDGFRYLLNTTPAATNTLQLTYEPSWELFRKKTSSPDHPGQYQAQEHYFYYDLKQYINTGGFYNSSQFPNYDKFDALKYSQTYRIRSLPYQQRSVSKATTSAELQASDYYWYDCKTLSDTVFYYDTVHITGPVTNCSTYTPPDSTKKVNQGGTLNSDGCIPITHPGLLPPAGYHITDMGGGQYMYCPNPSTALGRYVNLPNDMSTKLLLRRITRQVDTLDRRGSDVAFFNKYYRIARFKEATLPGPGSGTHIGYIWSPGFDTLTYYKANRHTALGLVAREENERGLVTNYYYHTVWNTSFIDNAHPCNSYGAYDLTGQGVPGCVTVGAGRGDSLQTCYTYNKDFTVNSITDPNGMVLASTLR